MINKEVRNKTRVKRHLRVRKKISGTHEKPRLCVFRSEKNIYAQIIDDVNQKTLVSASSIEKGFDAKGSSTENAEKVGNLIANKALKLGIKEVVFDRGGYLYHGRVKSLADSAREAGLVF